MAKHVFVVFTNPVEGKDATYNDWYDNRHLPDVLDVPGFVSAQRFRLSDTQRAAAAYRCGARDIVVTAGRKLWRIWLAISKMPTSTATLPQINRP